MVCVELCEQGVLYKGHRAVEFWIFMFIPDENKKISRFQTKNSKPLSPMVLKL